MDAGLFGSGITHVSETVYARSPDVVWRLGPDRVLVRRVGGRGEDAAAELLGAAALVWIAVVEPASRNEFLIRGPGGRFRMDADLAIDQLMTSEWLRIILARLS